MTLTRKILLDILGVAVLAVVAVGVWVSVRHKPAAQTASTPVQGLKTDAKPGQIVAGFPKDLIIDKNAQILQSYNLVYEHQTQYSVAFKTSMSEPDLFQGYTAYLVKNGYKIVNSVNSSSSPLNSIYASKDGADVNVVITADKDGKSFDVLVSYLKK